MAAKSKLLQGEVGDSLRGEQCWYVSHGGSIGASFQLAFGEKVPRPRVLSNKSHSDEYRAFEGQFNLLVWCTWRLDGLNRPLSSSDDDDHGIGLALDLLVGESVERASVRGVGMDLVISFSSGYTLQIFCDHVSKGSSFDSNWELFLPQKVISVGIGSVIAEETREG